MDGITTTAMRSAPESVILFPVRRPAVDPRARSRRERIAATFPWILFVAFCVLSYPLHNKLDAPAHPAEDQTASELEHDAKDGSIVGRVLTIVLGLSGAVLLYQNRARIRLSVPVFSILIAFLGWSVFSVVWADDPALTGRRLVSLVFMVTFAAGCAARLNSKNLTMLIAGIPVFTLIPGVLAEIAYGKFQPFSSTHRFAGTTPHPNVEAATLSVAAILLCWLILGTRGASRWRFVAAGLFVVAFLFATGSRTSILAVAVALSFSLFLIVARDRKRMLPVLMAAVFLLLGTAGLFKLAVAGSGHDPFAQAMKRPGDENDASTLNGRLGLWRQCLGYAAKRPLLGYGYGGFWTAKRIEAVSAFQTWPIQQSHSAYIEELLALGITGLLLYVALVLSTGWACLKQFFQGGNFYGAWAAVLVFVLLHNLTEAINVTPLFTNLAFNMMVISVAIIQPDRSLTPEADSLLYTA